MAKPKPDPVLTRNKILDAAESMVGEQGFNGLTMKSVAREAGMAVGKIYNFFPDKASLFIHLECRFSEGLVEIVEKVVSQPGSPANQFRQLLKEVFAYLSSNLGLIRMNVAPPYIHSDFIGTELEPIANKELSATMKAGVIVSELLREVYSGEGTLSDQEVRTMTLFLLNQITGLLLNSHSRNFSYMLGAESISQQKAAAAIDTQLDLIAELIIPHPVT
ncbi:MAG: TetR/AcrR family transcriptional regulator [Endozoicomonas sp.]